MRSKKEIAKLNQEKNDVQYPELNYKFEAFVRSLNAVVKENYPGNGSFEIEYDAHETVWFIEFTYNCHVHSLLEGMPRMTFFDTMRLEPGSPIEQFLTCVEIMDEKAKSLEKLILKSCARDQIGPEADCTLLHIRSTV